VTSYCGGGKCTSWLGENCDTCPQDCGPCCGNSKCQALYLESCKTCPQDCGYCPLECDDGNDIPWDGCTNGVMSEFQVNSEVVDDQFGPAVINLAVNGYGVFWTSDDQDGDMYWVFGQMYGNDGWPKGSEFQVNTYSTDSQDRPRAAALDDGRFVVVWQSWLQDGSGSGVYARVFDAALGTPVTGEFGVPTWTIDDQGGASATAVAGGKVIIAWEGSGDGDSYGIFARIFKSDGTPVGDDFQVNVFESEAQMAPHVATLNNGEVVAVWQTIRPTEDGWGISARRIAPNGTPVGEEMAITPVADVACERPKVAALPSGGFVVTWHFRDSASGVSQIAVQTFAQDGAKVGTGVAFGSGSGGDQLNPMIAVAQGGMLLCWQGNAPGNLGSGVYGRLFSLQGQPAAVPFQASLYVSGDRADVRCARNNDDDFVLVWHSLGQDGDSRGVFAQRFDSEGKRVYH